MYWQYRSDTNGLKMESAVNSILHLSNTTDNNTTDNNTTDNNTTDNNTTDNNTTDNNTTDNNTTDNNTTDTNTTDNTNVDIERPIRLAYVNSLNSWWPAADIAAGMGVPGYSTENIYNYIVLTFWSCGNRVFDTVKVWNDPIGNIGS